MTSLPLGSARLAHKTRTNDATTMAANTKPLATASTPNQPNENNT